MTDDPSALIEAIRAVKGSDELSRARRFALKRRLWQWQWEQTFRDLCEPLDFPPIKDLPDIEADTGSEPPTPFRVIDGGKGEIG